jgi:hypothetical protein
MHLVEEFARITGIAHDNHPQMHESLLALIQADRHPDVTFSQLFHCLYHAQNPQYFSTAPRDPLYRKISSVAIRSITHAFSGSLLYPDVERDDIMPEVRLDACEPPPPDDPTLPRSSRSDWCSVSAIHVIDDPSEAICKAADQAGVAIIAVLRGANDQPFERDTAARRIAAWALHPSVVLAVVPRLASDEQSAAIVAAARPLKGTMLMGLEVDGTQPPDAVPSAGIGGVDCLIVSLPCERLPHEEWRSWRADKPLVAWRATTTAQGTPAEHRQECDRIQASLAAWGLAREAGHLPWDWAGYLSAAW